MRGQTNSHGSSQKSLSGVFYESLPCSNVLQQWTGGWHKSSGQGLRQELLELYSIIDRVGELVSQ